MSHQLRSTTHQVAHGPEVDTIRGELPVPSIVLERARREEDSRQPVALLLYHREGAELKLLLPDSPVVVGRSAPSHLRIADVTLSREHARFSLIGDRILVEDLGSTNGTKLGGERIQRAEVSIGDELMMGGVLVCIHSLGAAEASLGQGLEGDDLFRRHLEDELGRARHFSRRFALMMVRAASAGATTVGERPAGRSRSSRPPAETVAQTAKRRAVPAADNHVSRWSLRVRAALRGVDRVALYSADSLQILLPEVDADAAIEVARRLATPQGGSGPPLLVGLALYPESASTAEMLIETSRELLNRASLDEPVQLGPLGARRAAPRPEAPLVVGEKMREIHAIAARVATSRIPVILSGETGTGKEVIARVLHDGGLRRDRPLVCVNCGALPAQLVESTLFGHEKGAFTGASQLQRGVFEEAHGGTVFLDEIGELPLAAQAALLRVLETGRLSRVGSSREVAVDVRIIAASHRDLEAMCDDESFRRDLYYRLNGITLALPPLRERVDEIAPLAKSFLMQANAANGRQIAGIQGEALALLERYPWPGNVRELKNAIERAVVITEADEVRVVDLPARVRALDGTEDTAMGSSSRLRRTSAPPMPRDERRRDAPGNSAGRAAPAESAAHAEKAAGAGGSFKEQVQLYEAQIIREALIAARWNQSEAARRLGIPLRTFVYKIKTLGIRLRDG